jgi:hypothetical protein
MCGSEGRFHVPGGNLVAEPFHRGGSFIHKKEGATMTPKRTYEKPVLQNLGLLRRLTKFSFNRNF